MDSFKITDAINNHLDSFEQEIKSYPHYSEIEKRIREAQKEIGYKFNNIHFLMLAFCRSKTTLDNVGKNNKTYMNDTLAQIGDAILNVIICEWCFAKGKNKKETDDIRQRVADNNHLSSITKENALTSFCYHERHFYDEAPNEYKVASGVHDSVIEAIIGAIYLDGGIGKARQWIYENIISTKDN